MALQGTLNSQLTQKTSLLSSTLLVHIIAPWQHSQLFCFGRHPCCSINGLKSRGIFILAESSASSL
jgi:hypothetical protein